MMYQDWRLSWFFSLYGSSLYFRHQKVITIKPIISSTRQSKSLVPGILLTYWTQENRFYPITFTDGSSTANSKTSCIFSTPRTEKTGHAQIHIPVMNSLLSQSFRTTESRLGNDHFLLNPSQFTINESSHHSTLALLTLSVVKEPTKTCKLVYPKTYSFRQILSCTFEQDSAVMSGEKYGSVLELPTPRNLINLRNFAPMSVATTRICEEAFSAMKVMKNKQK